MKIGLHTVFIAKENILFLSEWIAYYYALGVDKFYLYDNSGVNKIFKYELYNIGKHNIKPMKVNKYGEKYDEIVNMTSINIQAEMKKIQQTYPEGTVNYIKWKPKDKDGRIEYLQAEAQNDNLSKHRNDVDWMIQLDMDEFLVCNGDLKEVVSGLDEDGYEMAIINVQLILPSRFECMDRYIIDVKDKEAIGWANRPDKYIYKTKEATDSKVHSCVFRDGDNCKRLKGAKDTFYLRHHKINVDDIHGTGRRLREMNNKMNNLHQIPQKIIDKTKLLCDNEELLNWRKNNI